MERDQGGKSREAEGEKYRDNREIQRERTKQKTQRGDSIVEDIYIYMYIKTDIYVDKKEK